MANLARATRPSDALVSSMPICRSVREEVEDPPISFSYRHGRHLPDGVVRRRQRGDNLRLERLEVACSWGVGEVLVVQVDDVRQHVP